MAAQAAAHEAAIAEERRLREEEARRAQAEVQQQMAQMYSIQGLSVQMGQQLPPMAFPLIPAPAPATPPVSNLTTLVLLFQILET